MKEQKILIVLTGSLGDIARGLFIPAALKEHNQNVQVDWLVDKKWAELVHLNKYIDNVIEFDRKVSSVYSIYKRLKNENYTICMDLQRHFKSGLFSLFTGAKKRIGFHPKNAKEFNYLFNNAYIQAHEPNYPKIKQYQEILPLTKTLVPATNNTPETLVPATMNFGIEERVRNINLERFQMISWNRPLAIVLSSSWATKNWPDVYYLELVKLLTDKKHTVVLLGGKGDRQLAKHLIINDYVVNTAGETNLAELSAIISHSNLLIGPDSGPAHIASALHKPAITIFGPTSPERVVAYNNQEGVVLANVECSPCNKKICPLKEQICMKAVTPQMVYEKIVQYL
jgi:lipopolysaccharide heptosyltransferase II